MSKFNLHRWEVSMTKLTARVTKAAAKFATAEELIAMADEARALSNEIQLILRTRLEQQRRILTYLDEGGKIDVD